MFIVAELDSLSVRLAPWKRFKPFSESIFTELSNAILLLWIVLAIVFVVFVSFPNVSWSTLELRASLAPWNWFVPSYKIFYWPFQGGSSFADLLCFFYAFVRVCLYMPCFHLLGNGWLLSSRLWCLTVSFPLASWVSCGTWLYDSWSLHLTYFEQRASLTVNINLSDFTNNIMQ